MNSKHSYFVYIVSSRSRTIYTGVTNHIERRIAEHRQGRVAGFSKRYRTYRLVYYELFGDIRTAIEPEKQIKSWSRVKKVSLIEARNPTWADLSEGWRKGGKADPSLRSG